MDNNFSEWSIFYSVSEELVAAMAYASIKDKQ